MRVAGEKKKVDRENTHDLHPESSDYNKPTASATMPALPLIRDNAYVQRFVMPHRQSKSGAVSTLAIPSFLGIMCSSRPRRNRFRLRNRRLLAAGKSIMRPPPVCVAGLSLPPSSQVCFFRVFYSDRRVKRQRKTTAPPCGLSRCDLATYSRARCAVAKYLRISFPSS